MSESDGISPTTTAWVTWAPIHKSNSPPGLLKVTQSGLVWQEHPVSTKVRGDIEDTGEVGGEGREKAEHTKERQ